ncbi:MAG TPA: PKD domain-containing protein [Candidatus Binatia bacterium]|nr:PKD domain-containing protein [Candidatus Binatia bacterium]
MRILGCSAVLGTLFTLTLAACGGGTPTTETPKPQTATTAAPAPSATQAPPATPPTTTAGAKTGEQDEDMASPLLAWADSDTDEGKAPLTIQFKADIEGGTPPLTYLWKFGDGSPDSTEANPKHTYQKVGKYRADLEVKDAGGDSDSDYLEIDVQ